MPKKLRLGILGEGGDSLIIRIPRCFASEVLEESLKTVGFHKMLKLSSFEYPDGSASGIIY